MKSTRLRDTPKGVALTLWLRNHVLGLAAASFSLMVGSVGLSTCATVQARGESRARVAAVRSEATQRARVDTARSAQLAWDRKASDHRACVRQSSGRAEVRRTFFDVFDFIAAVPTQSPDTARQVQDFVARSKEAVDARLPPLDCTTDAPFPKGRRPQIPAAPFLSCAAARAAGVTPLRKGDLGYSTNLDGDGDGLACE